MNHAMRLPLCGTPAFFLICLATLLPLIPVSAEPVCNESDEPGEQLLGPRGGDFFAAEGLHDLSGGDTPPVTNSTTDS